MQIVYSNEVFSLICCKIHCNWLSVDDRKLLSCGKDGFLKIFDMNTGSEVFAKNSNNQLK